VRHGTRARVDDKAKHIANALSTVISLDSS